MLFFDPKNFFSKLLENDVLVIKNLLAKYDSLKTLLNKVILNLLRPGRTE